MAITLLVLELEVPAAGLGELGRHFARRVAFLSPSRGARRPPPRWSRRSLVRFGAGTLAYEATVGLAFAPAPLTARGAVSGRPVLLLRPVWGRAVTGGTAPLKPW
ncbi:MAG: hypothetical protein M3042_02925 [Actinomycetota bacterium]|nr:hypothetical protein [Actinomycetota bacterium]